MMYTDMVYYVLIIVRLCGYIKEKRELRVKMCSYFDLIIGICEFVVQKTLVQLDAVIAVIDLFLLFERGACLLYGRRP